MTTTFKNLLNGEEVLCGDLKKNKEFIDGVEYLVVYRKENPRRLFKMRRDILQRVVPQRSK